MSGDLFDGMYDTAPAEEKTSSEKGNDAPKAAFAPLAERMRPKTLDEVVGQQHLIGPGAPLRVAFENHRPHSMILWGPPGVGKTTLARLMADAFDLPFLSISAVLGGLKDIREAVDFAKAERKATGRPTLLFVDEVHRFNKSQQDAFLPHVESGLFIFVGATTENPSFEVVSALLSRATVYQLESLKPEESRTLLDRVMTREFPTLKLTEEAVEVIVGLSDGDARRLLNAVDVACTMAKERRVEEITAEFLRKTLPATLRRFDKGGDNFYDQISAMHKSVRGSDPDAALYWMCRMLDGGRPARDPHGNRRHFARRPPSDAARRRSGGNLRTTRFSRRGVGACAGRRLSRRRAQEQRRLHGLQRDPLVCEEGRLAPRAAPTKLMKELGYHEGYRYAHDEPGAFAAGEIYLPEGLEDQRWYFPTDRGLEIKIGEKLARLRALNEEARRQGKGRKR